MTGTPFIKWVGGKGRLLAQLDPLLPSAVGTWVEPFVGGGSVLLGLGKPRAEVCFATDINYALVNAYRAVRDRVDDLIAELEGLRRLGHYSMVYYQLRDEFNARPVNAHSIHADVRYAALFIWLNKTGFNGLYRVNKEGKLNVSCGNYADPQIVNVDELLETSGALRLVGFGCLPYAGMLTHCSPDDFVYLDPPYTPTSATASFAAYNEGGFTHADHVALRDACVDLSRRGVRFMLSQADTSLTRELYAVPGWNTRTVTVGRSISSKASTRGDVTELVVRNYTLEDE